MASRSFRRLIRIPRSPTSRMMRFHIQVKELFSRRVVATCSFASEGSHRSDAVGVGEKRPKVPFRHEGWQDALEAAYPFKINRFTIVDGDVVYIQDAVSPPLHLAKLNFTTDNIRNIYSPESAYPSRFHARW